MHKPNFINEQSKITEIMRVNQAGEYGAVRIYQGQLRFTKNIDEQALINSMLAHELVHLNYFNQQLKTRRIPPSLFMPLWHIGGYMIGAMSAICGAKTAMLVTKAVEEVIEQHYSKQLSYLDNLPKERELTEKIKQFKQDEANHKNIAISYNNNKTNSRVFLSKLIKKLTKVAIFMSKKL